MSVDFLTRYRSSLENVDCPWVVQMPDAELETCLFEPGPQHNKALIWALTKIDPELQAHLVRIQDRDKEKEIVRLFAFTGLVKSSESDIVLGHASRKVLESFWDCVLYQLNILQEYDTEEEQENVHPDSTFSFLFSLMLNSEFWDLLEKKPSLLPSDDMLPSVTPALEDLVIQLEEAEKEVYKLTSSDSDLGQASGSSLSSRGHKEERIQKDMGKCVQLRRHDINDCYKKFLELIVSVSSKKPPNPAAEQLAQVAMTLQRKLQEFVTFLENVEETERIGTLFSKQALSDNHTTKDTLNDFIAIMVQQISAIIAVLSANGDLLK